MKRLRKKNFFDYSWKENPNAVYVGRPTPWGNPYRVAEVGLEKALSGYRVWLDSQLEINPEFLRPLVGKDLVCFCGLDQPCHADILIEYVEKMYPSEVAP